mmetsp:Transcript_19615/g.40361  ORF Transcript_19615/g.40361 Transcript_19615/m.40361 type:complete len:584 (+) Transcript_19615:17-1768(+)
MLFSHRITNHEQIQQDEKAIVSRMIDASKDEIARLMGRAKKIGYREVDEVYLDGSNGNVKRYGYYDESSNPSLATSTVYRFWKIAGIAALVGFFFFAGTSCQSSPKAFDNRSCRFCDQSPPKLHHDKSYTIQRLTNNGNGDEPIVVTPMTVSYDYELRDGELLFTSARHELIPNLGYDYAVLGVGAVRNVYRGTKHEVSLDEVYVHHFTLFPFTMMGAEALARDNVDDPYMRLPEGYALHVTDDENPHLRTNAHLISNKNLVPIEGSTERAHKECNECYYAPGKGADCTPEVSGTFLCCGDSPSCTTGDLLCACPITTTTTHTRSKPTTTKYTIEVDILVSRDIDKFQRVEQWNFAAPKCSVNVFGDSVLEDYPSDHYCAKVNLLSKPPTKKPSKKSMPVEVEVLSTGDGALFHQVYENNQEPYLRTAVSVLAPVGGKLVWAQSHLHTGGVNATLYKNGVPICITEALHGTSAVPSSNARNEQNHLVRITSCYDQISSGIRFESGDVFTTESYYYAGTDDSRFSNNLAAGEHKNAMSMFFTTVVMDGDSHFLTEDRTSFNLWNDFVHMAGIRKSMHGKKKNRQ